MITEKSRQEKILELREATYMSARDILNKYGKCAIIRPPGFGKTGILTRMLKGYKKVLYLYPAEVVRSAVLDFYYGSRSIPADRSIPNVEFMTYTKLVYLTLADMKRMGPYDVIIADECHKLGAMETMRALDMLIEAQPQAKLLGATATPDRMDLVDEIGRYFDDHVTPEYNLHDAFKDGILLKPFYVYCGYGRVEENENLVIRDVEKEVVLLDDESKIKLMEELSQQLIEISNLYNMENVIKDSCNKYLDQTNAMRFIVFFPTYETLHDKLDTVKAWFQSAFPSHTVRTMIVTSETEEYSRNVFSLNAPVSGTNAIELIGCCDMLNMGYHVTDITGIVMYRGTKSGIVYGQQLGRVLSTGATKPGLVFDVVDNLHTQASYSVLGQESRYTAAGRARKESLEKAKNLADNYQKYRNGEIVVLSSEEKTEFARIASGQGEEPKWSALDDSELNALERRFKDGYMATRQSVLHPDDLIAVRFEGKYRELIAKTVAEAKSMRCRQAWARWVEQGGEPFDEDGRIRTRAQILALTPPEHHPLPPYCHLKNVSVAAVLKEMGVKD